MRSPSASNARAPRSADGRVFPLIHTCSPIRRESAAQGVSAGRTASPGRQERSRAGHVPVRPGAAKGARMSLSYRDARVCAARRPPGVASELRKMQAFRGITCWWVRPRKGRTMRDDPSVIALVTRVCGGDHEAWNEIIDRYAPLVWAICNRYQLQPAGHRRCRPGRLGHAGRAHRSAARARCAARLDRHNDQERVSSDAADSQPV